MNTHEEYVTYAQAKALKELGFDWPCECHYAKEDAPYDCVWMANSGQYSTNSMFKDIGGERTTAPTQAAACRWLREEKGIIVYVTPEFYEGDVIENVRWYYRGQPLQNLRNQFGGGCKRYPTYEAALSTGIDRALELLKGGEK